MTRIIFEDFTDSANRISLPTNLVFNVTHYSDVATGGSDTAELQVTGPTDSLWLLFSILGLRIIIYADDGTVVWHGLVEEVYVETGLLRRGLSIKEMSNRISVAYTAEDIDGNVERATTTWAEDTESIARFGTKEEILSQSDSTAVSAAQYRDTQLARKSVPTKVFDLNGNGAVVGSIYCTGLINTLSWVHYDQPSGLVVHETGTSDTQVVGVGVTSDRIGFTTDGKIHHIDGGMAALQKDANIQVVSSASNDGAHLVASTDSRDAVIYVASTIFFDVTDDVNSSENALTIVDNNDYIEIAGANQGANNGVKLVTSTGSGHITVNPATIVDEAAGASVTITRGTYARTGTTFVEEYPPNDANTTSVYVHGYQFMQTFTTASVFNWTVNQVSIRVKKIGTPADNLVIELVSVSGLAPNASLESIAIDASTMSDSTHTWIVWQFSNTTTLQASTVYGLYVHRSGANSLTDYFSVELDTAVGYTDGAYTVYNGVAWTTPNVPASLYFRVEGAEETTTQMLNIVAFCGQFLVNTDIIDTAGVLTNQYRAGDLDGLTEFDKLLEIGTSTSTRLLATVTPDRRVRIYDRPASSIRDNIINNDGSITTATNTRMPDGRLIAGSWLRTKDIPLSVGALTDLDTLFIESSEINADGVLRPHPEEQRSVWDL